LRASKATKTAEGAAKVLKNSSVAYIIVLNCAFYSNLRKKYEKID